MNIKLSACCLLAILLAACGDSASGQPKGAGQGSQEYREPKEVALTPDHMRRYVALKMEMRLLQAGSSANSHDPARMKRFMEQLQALTRKHGFDSQEGYDVQWTIGSIFASFDHGSRTWVDPRQRLRQQLETIRKQDGLSAEDRKAAEKGIEEMLAMPRAVAPANIRLATEHYEALRKAIIGN